jgi:predicted MFS family arabinose efflux permease
MPHFRQIVKSAFRTCVLSNLGFNFLLLLTPEDRRPRYTALYQIVVTAALAAGAALGGIAATRWGYASTFVLSGVGRLVAALLFARFVHQQDRR